MTDNPAAKALFDRMPEESKKDIKDTYGDDLSKWYADYWKFREDRIVKRGKKLAEFGFDVRGMTEEILRVAKERTGK